MITDQNNEPFLVDGIQLKEGDKVLVNTSFGDYETKVVKEWFMYTLEENNTNLKDSACLLAIKKIL